MHSGPFGCLTKLGAKRAELVQKFVPRSRVRIFHNERTRTTPLDPKLMFWCVSYYYFGAFGTVWLSYETRCTTGRTTAEVRATKLRRNFLQRTYPITALDPELTAWCGSYYFLHSGPFGCLTKLCAKRAELVQKFVPRSRFGIFCNECTQSTLLDPELTFCVFRTIWVHSEPFGGLTKFGTKRAELV